MEEEIEEVTEENKRSMNNKTYQLKEILSEKVLSELEILKLELELKDIEKENFKVLRETFNIEKSN